MILVIFSYVKSAILFTFLTLAVAAGIVAACLFTQATVDFALRIAGLCVLMIAAYAASCAYAVKLVSGQADKMGNADKTDELCARLRKLSKRTLFGGVRGMILALYAYALLCSGKYREAEIAASDSLVASGKGVKADVAALFSKIYFMLGDEKYFEINYVKAMQNDGARSADNVSVAVLAAMRLSLQGDNAAALDRLNGFDTSGVSPLLQKNISELKKYIQQKKDAA